MNKKSQFLISFLAFCILCGAIYLTIALISPPAPLPVDAPATEFSAGRAMQDLEVIAREPHPMGPSPAHRYESLSKSLTENGRKEIELFTWDSVAEKTLDVYNGLTIERLKKQLEERERIYKLNIKDLHRKKK